MNSAEREREKERTPNQARANMIGNLKECRGVAACCY